MYQTISSAAADERVDAKLSKRGAVVCGSAIGVNFFLYGILSCSGIHEIVWGLHFQIQIKPAGY